MYQPTGPSQVGLNPEDPQKAVISGQISLPPVESTLLSSIRSTKRTAIITFTDYSGFRLETLGAPPSQAEAAGTFRLINVPPGIGYRLTATYRNGKIILSRVISTSISAGGNLYTTLDLDSTAQTLISDNLSGRGLSVSTDELSRYSNSISSLKSAMELALQSPNTGTGSLWISPEIASKTNQISNEIYNIIATTSVTVAPRISWSNPANKGTIALASPTFSVGFTQPMDPNSGENGSFEFMAVNRLSGQSLFITESNFAIWFEKPTWTNQNQVLTFSLKSYTPKSLFSGGFYDIQLSRHVLKGANGLMLADAVYTVSQVQAVTQPASSPPRIVSFQPNNPIGDTSIYPRISWVITFSESIRTSDLFSNFSFLVQNLTSQSSVRILPGNLRLFFRDPVYSDQNSKVTLQLLDAPSVWLRGNQRYLITLENLEAYSQSGVKLTNPASTTLVVSTSAGVSILNTIPKNGDNHPVGNPFGIRFSKSMDVTSVLSSTKIKVTNLSKGSNFEVDSNNLYNYFIPTWANDQKDLSLPIRSNSPKQLIPNQDYEVEFISSNGIDTQGFPISPPGVTKIRFHTIP
ncbi:hypothetical protein HYY75_02335 [bacterium]|nr:hypothetical protein [bacterium]